MRENRAQYVSAALTIIRAWISAGQPKQPVKSLAGFNEWSDLCRQPLLWLGMDDPVENVFKVMNTDPDRELLGRFLHAWYEKYGSDPKMVRDLIDINCSPQTDWPDWSDILNDIAGDRNHSINRRILGGWIKRRANQIVDGFRFVRVEGNRSAARWRVEQVQ